MMSHNLHVEPSNLCSVCNSGEINMSDSERLDSPYFVSQEIIDQSSDTLKALARLAYAIKKEASTSALSIEMIENAKQALSAQDEAGGIGDA